MAPPRAAQAHLWLVDRAPTVKRARRKRAPDDILLVSHRRCHHSRIVVLGVPYCLRPFRPRELAATALPAWSKCPPDTLPASTCVPANCTLPAPCRLVMSRTSGTPSSRDGLTVGAPRRICRHHRCPCGRRRLPTLNPLALAVNTSSLSPKVREPKYPRTFPRMLRRSALVVHDPSHGRAPPPTSCPEHHPDLSHQPCHLKCR